MSKVVSAFIGALLLAGCAVNSTAVYFVTADESGNLTDCGKTAEFPRAIKNPSPAGALRELIKGPSESERSAGALPHWVTDESDLIGVTVIEGTAYINWRDLRQKIPNASSSCGSLSFLAPAEKTLMQFPGIEKVVHQIEGRSDVFYEWLQMETPE